MEEDEGEDDYEEDDFNLVNPKFSKNPSVKLSSDATAKKANKVPVVEGGTAESK